MISPFATFAYVGVVPDRLARVSGRWQLRDASGAAASTRGDDLVDDRLVEPRPSLEITELGLTPDVRISPYTRTVRPTVFLSRLTIRDGATAFSFCVDRALTRSWRAGDVLHLVLTGCSGLGLSVIRAGRLLAACGAVTAVPHDGLIVRIPWDVIHETEGLFRRLDPLFEFPELPIEVRVGSEGHVFYRGRDRIEGYQVDVDHGFYQDEPGTAECAGISRMDSCPDRAAICSALLMEYPDLA